ncbi:MAG: FTR1 family iron permease [Propionibacteriaceae bacterium]|nr:FTR1 family iron permease [Propionibacteriaceae bacterium]
MRRLARAGVRALAGLALAVAVVGLWSAAAPPAAADDTEPAATWSGIASTMTDLLEQSWQTYQAGQLEAARDVVNDAYYGYYEAKGFERNVMAYISGQAATDAEYEFTLIKRAILAGGPDPEVRQHIDALAAMLVDQAHQLDGSEPDPTGLFVKSLIIILREGFEAIIVLGAIIAYLVKSGAGAKLPIIYLGAAAAVGASVLLAVALNALTALAGAPQEIIEGVTILVAMVMLIWVSNWIAAKSHTGAWNAYIKAQADQSLSRRSVWSLAFVAFLAVFREGAEVILLYQALRAGADGATGGIWLGLGVGLVGLVGVYLAMRYLSVRLPLRPFFLATSLLLALLALSFAGSGVKELQEGDVIPMTPLPGFPSIDLLGLYPTVQTLSAQGLVLAVMTVGLIRSFRRSQPRPLTPTGPGPAPAEPALAPTAAAPAPAGAGQPDETTSTTTESTQVTT